MDIVEQLRELFGPYKSMEAHTALEAADEIQRLRALIHPFEGAVAKVEEQGREITRLQAENERLRAEGAGRYWEGRWRDEKAENERLRGTLSVSDQHQGA